MCAVGLLLCYGSSSSFFLYARFPSFFFLSSGFSSFSRFVVLCSMYFEITCKRLEIYVALTCPTQQAGSEFLKLKFHMELEFLKLEMLVCKTPFIPVLTYYILSPHCASLQISPNITLS